VLPTTASGKVTDGPDVEVDGTGTITMLWEETEFDANNSITQRTANAARAQVSTLNFKGWEINGQGQTVPVPPTNPSSGFFSISDDQFLAAGLSFSVHRSGRIIFSWSYKTFPSASGPSTFLSSGIRRFR
jgi:hypothetical protein